MIITFNTLSDINSAADEFLNATAGNKHFAFYGSMGAGKTTFIKALCQKLNVIDVVASPTFAIINEYHTSDNNKIFRITSYNVCYTKLLRNPSHISLKLGLNKVTPLYALKFLFLGSTNVGILRCFALATTCSIIAGVIFPLS